MITEEQINAIKPEGFDDAQWKDLSEKFVSLHNTDINGLQNNELKLKQEKVAVQEKYRALEASVAENAKKYETDIAGLNSQIEELKKNSPESLKAAYEAEQKKQAALLESTIAGYDSKIANKDKRIAELEHGVFQRDCIEAFEKAIQGKNIDSSTIQDIRQFCMGDNFSKFKRSDVGDGKSIITREDGKDIATSVEEFFSTPTGKRFLLNDTSGGGADSGKNTPDSKKTTMSRADFDAIKDPVLKIEAARKYTIV